MKNKILISALSIALAVILILGVSLIIKDRKLNEYEVEIKNEHSKNLSELNSAVNNITLLLLKARHSSSPAAMSSFVTELFGEAELAKSALSQLPASSRPETLNRFLSQVGNYALSLSKSVIRGDEITQKQQENLKVLSDTAETIAQAVLLSDTTYNNSEYWAEEIENELSGENSALADSLTALEENLTDYPTLIYDGPYSDHIMTKTPLCLEDKENVSREEALVKATSVLGDPADKLKFSSEEKGKIETYRFSNKTSDIAISKIGGYPVYYRKNRTIAENKLEYKKAILKARSFLEKAGFSSMQETYYFTDGGVAVVNFAYVDGQTLCYTDLIKVGVALDNGEIVFFESSGYLYNHTKRSFQTPTYTKEQAEEKLNPSLKIKDEKIVLIPVSGGTERRCYEFLCEGDGDMEMLVYLNVNTLEEEELLILLKTDGGTLVK